MQIPDGLKDVVQDGAKKLKGTDRRTYMARVARAYGRGGQSRVAKEFGWGRNTLRKGERELKSGIGCVDGFRLRGAKRMETRLPNLLADIRDIVDGQSQVDPTFKTTRVYRRITAAEVRRQLREEKGYTAGELPSERTIRNRLNELGYRPAKVRKSKPQKKCLKRTRSLKT